MEVKSQYRADKKYLYPVWLDWENNPHMEYWDQVCMWAVEHFGLPGKRYRVEITENNMTWFFEDHLDRLIFTLAWGNNNGNDI